VSHAGRARSLRRGNNPDREVLVHLDPPGSPFYDGEPLVHGSYVTVEGYDLLEMPEEEFVAAQQPITADGFAQRACGQVQAQTRGGRTAGWDLEQWGAHEWSNAKPGSIYHALKQMAKQGLLLAHEIGPSTADGPPRTEYELTQRGSEEFFSLFREALVSHDQKMDVVSSGIGFIVRLPREEAVAHSQGE
jgi:DNA-binding PadR family transcriptional regulator